MGCRQCDDLQGGDAPAYECPNCRGTVTLAEGVWSCGDCDFECRKNSKQIEEINTKAYKLYASRAGLWLK